MRFKDVVGQRLLINHLTEIIDAGRVSHAQMLVGKMGYGTLAIAMGYVQYLMCEHRVHYGEGSELRADSCGECPNCKKIEGLMHPDVHLYFPTTTTSRVKDKPCCIQFREDFNEFLKEKGWYVTINDWYQYSGAENKQGQYRELDAEEMVRTLGMKSYEGRQKVLLIWMPELMTLQVSNEILKSLEEPYDNTLIMLVAENTERMLQTVLSRVQTIGVHRITDAGLDESAEGDFIESQRLLSGSEDMEGMREMFVGWMRLLFKLKMDALSDWVENMAGLGRERQKAFLQYAMHAVRSCFGETAGVAAADLRTGDERFDKMFPAMITVRNVEQIYENMNEALRSVGRNVNSKVLFMQLSFALSRHIKNR